MKEIIFQNTILKMRTKEMSFQKEIYIENIKKTILKTEDIKTKEIVFSKADIEKKPNKSRFSTKLVYSKHDFQTSFS